MVKSEKRKYKISLSTEIDKISVHLINFECEINNYVCVRSVKQL